MAPPSTIYATIILLILCISSWTTINCLIGPGGGPNVKHYDPVLYDLEHVKSQHARSKREIVNNNNPKNDFPIEVNMKARGRDFPLNLAVNNQLFHPNAIFQNSDGIISYDMQKAVYGSLNGQPNSSVVGVLSSSGTFDGVITTGGGDEYYVEPYERYWTSDTLKSTGIMYNVKDVHWPKSEESACESQKLHLAQREENLKNETSHKLHRRSILSNSQLHHSRSKRWIVDSKKKTCMLYLQADYLFYSRVGSEEATIDIMTGHIQRLNQIYSSTDFDGDGEPDDIQFMIKRIKVYTKNGESDEKYPYDGHFEVIKFLEKFSEGDYDSFCLAYMFTFRDFEGGTLGLAWTGDLKNAGGVCEKQGHFRGGIKSLNTGIITLLNYGKVVSPAVSHVTLAHEVGHNFGSPHDPDGDRICTPGGEDGNYIMFARATAGDRKNNNKFSPCSLKNIGPVLYYKARNIHGCFTTPQASICGNGVVEEGEDCDCGWEEDCRESCCFPMKRNYARTELPCRLKPGSHCSPSKGPCCTGNCTLKYADKCRDDNGCRNTGYCDGTGALCPPSILKPNKTICNKESVCFMGECTGSICLAYGLESCQCNQGPNDRPMKLCEICCKLPGDNQTCKSSFDWTEEPYDVPELYAKPGTPCRNYTGYCDSYHFCREVDPSGPLATLRKLLAADEGLATIAEWIDNHWYVAVAAILVLIILMILMAKMCGKTAKARLRKLTVMHSNLEAIQIQRTYLEDGDAHTVHPTTVRKKIPFKKKVRERRSKHRSQNGNAKKRKTSTGAAKSGGGKGSLWKRKKRETPKLEMFATNFAETKLESPQNSPNIEGPLLAATATIPAPNISHLPGPSTSNAIPSTSQVQSQNQLSHDHEPRTAIVPHAKDAKRRHGNSHSKKKTSQSNGGVTTSSKKKKHKSKSKHEGNSTPHQSSPISGLEAEAVGVSSSNSKPHKKDEIKSKKLSGSATQSKESGEHPRVKQSKQNGSDNLSSSKPSLQATYKPPFSIKLEFTKKPTSNNNSHNESSSSNKKSEQKSSKSADAVTTPAKSSSKHAKKDQLTPVTTTPAKYKGSSSLLKRRKANILSNPKNPGRSGELQILIPSTFEEDETLTPTTPAAAIS